MTGKHQLGGFKIHGTVNWPKNDEDSIREFVIESVVKFYPYERQDLVVRGVITNPENPEWWGVRLDIYQDGMFLAKWYVHYTGRHVVVTRLDDFDPKV